MNARLILRYEFSDEDDFGWLSAELETMKVRGKTGFWVQCQDVQGWADELAVFPMRGGARSEADWGQSDSDGSNYRPIVRVVVSANSKGHLEVLAALGDHTDPRIQCQSWFNTYYPALESFAAQLARVMRKEEPEAVLHGSSA